MRDPHRCVTLQLSWELSSHWLPRNTNPVYHLWESLVISRFRILRYEDVFVSYVLGLGRLRSPHPSTLMFFICHHFSCLPPHASCVSLLLFPFNLVAFGFYQYFGQIICCINFKYILMKCYLILEVMTATTISCGKTNGILLN